VQVPGATVGVAVKKLLGRERGCESPDSTKPNSLGEKKVL